MPEETEKTFDEYPLKTYDKLRYCDTDRQGHVNNAVFATFLETGRTELLYKTDKPLYRSGASFVIAKLSLEFLDEINWPGSIDIGTAVSRIGTSSITMVQGLFQEGRLCARSESVIVQVDNETRRSTPLSDETRERLQLLKG